MAAKVHHPIFARIYARLSAGAEAKGAAEHRDEMLADLQGRVVEVGADNGLNFAHYPPSVTEVVAVEPEAHLRKLAETAAGDAKVPITVVDGTAGALPVEDDSCDAAVLAGALFGGRPGRGPRRGLPCAATRGRAALLRTRPRRRPARRPMTPNADAR